MKRVSFTIPALSPVTANNCHQSFIVGYKLSSDANWTEISVPKGDPDTVVELVLVADSIYDIRVQAICCNGGTSSYATFSVDTSVNSPI